MNTMHLIFAAIALLSFSGVPGLFMAPASPIGQRVAAGSMAAGGAAGVWGAARILLLHAPASSQSPWFLPMGRFSVSADALSAFFLVPVFVVPALGAVYGLDYWQQAKHSTNGRKLALFYGLLAGSMALVVIARDALLFLVAWEIMAVAAFFAASAEDEKQSVRSAGWIYLVSTHAGSLCLLAMFALWHRAAGSFELAPLAPGALSPSMTAAIFILGTIGFGFKAGLMPLHVWLPEAHANAPSHVSAVMSGVMLKMGVYGILRIAALLPAAPIWCGGLLLGLGAATGVLGIAFATVQGDLKRLLAYSSIENIGIVILAVGLALLGRSLHRTDWLALGLGGALLHVWNHSLFKPLLFMNAGTLIHAAQTRRIDRMGGLAKLMPRTALFFLLGSVAICALPPLNGFAGEWLIYLGFLRTVGSQADSAFPAAALGAAVLAMTGALAAACFVKLFGTVFLGESRSGDSHAAHDPGRKVAFPMGALAAGCLILGLAPWLAAPALDQAIGAWSGGDPAPASLRLLAPMGWIGAMGIGLIGGCAGIGIVVKLLLGNLKIGSAGTWDCGYARPSSRMQYTGSSFGESIAGMFAWAIWPKENKPQIAGLMPKPSAYASVASDAVLDRLVLPVFRFSERIFLRARLLQQGNIQLYIVYSLAAVLVLLVWGRIGF